MGPDQRVCHFGSSWFWIFKCGDIQAARASMAAIFGTWSEMREIGSLTMLWTTSGFRTSSGQPLRQKLEVPDPTSGCWPL